MDEVADRLVPAMTGPEIDLFRASLRVGANYLEFGSGGSTAEALAAGVESLVAVESAKVWVDKLRAHPSIAPHLERGVARLVHVDVGPVKDWGFPADKSAVENWPAYSQAVWNSLDPKALDIVLVDGRFRVACALNAVWRCRPDTTILIHDFWDRPYYRDVLRFTDEVASAERMAVLHPRAVLDWPALIDTLLRHTLDPR